MERIEVQFRLLLVLLGFLKLACCLPVFHVAPIKTTALENTNVTFYCIFQSSLASNQVVVWEQGGVEISRDGTIEIQNSRLHIRMDRSQASYNLRITSVTRADDIDYTCLVIDTDNNQRLLESDPARLEVHHLPPAQYPRCFPLTKDTFNIGEEITITCESKSGNPPVNLKWTCEGKTLQIRRYRTPNGLLNIDFSFTVEPKHHGAIFQCKLTSSVYDTVQRSCSLGPLDINFKPVEVKINDVQPIFADQEIELECNANANPPPLYSWTFGRDIDQTRITYLQDRKKVIFTPQMTDNGLTASCNATNDLGTARDTVTLRVDPTPTTSRPIPPKFDITNDVGSPTKPRTDPSSSKDIVIKPEVLAIVASTLTLILLVLIILVIVTCRCRPQNPKTVAQMPQMIYGQYGPGSIQGWEQSSIYFEPRDRISVRDMPTWQRPTPWHRNVAVQVPWVEEPPYEEIGHNWDEGLTLEI